MARRVFISVAEASADLHAGNLIRAMKEIEPGIVVEGIGGQRMREAGAVVHHETVDRAAMGWRAALRAAEVWRLLRWAKKYYAENPPDLAVCCDSWSMNWHFAKLAKEHGVPVFYYIAPQTWASREGRVKKLEVYVDQLGCIWPFEEPYFRKHGVAATYVGHPLFDEVPGERVLKKLWDGKGKGPVVGILPGSRKSIAKQNFPRQLEVAEKVKREFPQAKFLVPTTAATYEIAKEMVRGRENVVVGVDCFDEMVKQCDVCLAVSGTATLHAAAWGVPMLVVYHVNPLAWQLVGRWVVKTRTYSMVNWLSGEEGHVVPEYIPWYGSTGRVAGDLVRMLREPWRLEEQRGRLEKIVSAMDRPGASRTAAELALNL